ncbi:MAG: hypothetical protein QG552_1171 [Thermodesulfobacteriota bacterium]|nr:hypothetical protein [Thermodesulfobacteriota bacterium]
MNLRTASETLSFIRELEEKAALFYEKLAERFPEKREEFLIFAKENRKTNKQIQMAYQSVITDAIEGCYAFNLEADDYAFDTDLPDTAKLSDAAAKALAIEGKILACYALGAEQSGSLLADVPRNFKIVMRKRNDRLEKLKSFTSS